MAPVPMAKVRSMPRWKSVNRSVSSQKPASHSLAIGLSVPAPISLAMRLAHSRQTRRAGRRESLRRLRGFPSTPA